MNRVASIAIAVLLALASVLGVAPDASAARAHDAPAARNCCGDNCRCGERCPCSVDDAPATPDGDTRPALPERSRGERAAFVALLVACADAVTVLEPVDLGAPSRAATELPAPPSGRERLALVSRWTT